MLVYLPVLGTGLVAFLATQFIFHDFHEGRGGYEKRVSSEHSDDVNDEDLNVL